MSNSTRWPLPGWDINKLKQMEGLPDAQRRMLLRAGLGISVGGSALLLAACGSDSEGSNFSVDGKDGSGAAEGPGNPGTDSESGGVAVSKVSSFTLAVLPDTQFYSRYATTDENTQFQNKYGSTPYEAQTKWIVEQAAALKIPFTVHLGDVVDQQGKPAQWVVADKAMRILENADMPYSILAGNHDVINAYEYVDAGSQWSGTDAQRNLAAEPYLANFPASRAAKQATFGGRDSSGFHEYHVFEAEGNKFLVLSLSWRASDAAIDWARQVLAQHPTLPAILVNHQLLNIDADGMSPLEVPYGLMLWEKLIKDNDQIFMTLNGHYHGAAHLTKTNAFGNAVEEMVVDYQMAYMGGNGLMRHYEFDLTNGKIRVLSFSPWVPQKPAEALNQFDVAVLTEPNEQFEISMDFKARFARFNPGFKIPEAANEPLNEQAKALILANYKEPEVAALVPAADENDYPLVASTVAHWRFFGGAAGSVVPVNYQIADQTGKNPLYREELVFNGATIGSLGDVTWSNDHHYLSAAPGSVNFANSAKNPLRMNYFTTFSDASINIETFETGYTIEAFVKIDESWTAGQNAWMNIMQRDGRRGQISGFPGGDGDECPIIFAVSSLREIQWEVLSGGNSKRIASNWSGEIIAGKWVHIAIVNDVKSNETIMYIEGAPVLRNAAQAPGIAYRRSTDRMVVGGGAYAGSRSGGFLGKIGEIRICSEALPASMWLTARRRVA